MDKVSHSNIQTRASWDRQPVKRGHRSAVEGALKAHRERREERQQRVQERLAMVQNMSNDFFPSPQNIISENMASKANQATMVESASVDSNLVQQQSSASINEVQNFNPRQMDDIFNEAQFGSVGDKALALVDKEMANPEDGSLEDMPKGSYVDYTV